MKLALVLLIAITLGACGGSDSAGPGGSADVADQVSLSFDSSPINDQLGIDLSLRAGDVALLEQGAELKVAECMANAGFDYVPIGLTGEVVSAEGIQDPETREFAQANGYGISTESAFASIDGEFGDPNEDIVAGLSRAQLVTYEVTLYGAQVEGASDRSEEGGCLGQGYADVYDQQERLDEIVDFFGDFGPELTELENRLVTDPRLIELETEWATCMTEQGFPVASREELFVELDRRMVEAAPDFDDDEPAPELLAAMAEVADWERSAAVADWDCTEVSKVELDMLRYGYEALFLEENKDRLPTPDS